MVIFVFQILLTISLGGIVFLLINKIPLLCQEEAKNKKKISIQPLKENIVSQIKAIKPVFQKNKGFFLRKIKQKKITLKDKKEQIEKDRDYWNKVSQ
ncbi:hypothetical protein FJ208_01265 [Candidatus Gribaldobacteria bacterium]|nr:hypothetical protein [Candidatus Gribaldobacteria bacterium]